MLYNALRFDSPLEFGQHYQLAGDRHDTLQHFGLHYFWFNFRVYFLQPARWDTHFPFVHESVSPWLPTNHREDDPHFGILTNIPVVWLALAMPLAWRGRSAQSASILRLFVAAVVLLLGICALTMCLYYYAATRFKTEFLPEFVLLAVVGILGLERALAGRPHLRRAARWGWGLLVGFSVAFNLLASVGIHAEARYGLAVEMAQQGRLPEAIQLYEEALRLNPDHAEAHSNLGIALAQAGRVREAIGQFEQALRIMPNDAKIHYNLGLILELAGKPTEAIGQFEEALRIDPDDPDTHNNLGIALGQVSRIPEAITHYERALRLKPDYAEAKANLQLARQALTRLQEQGNSGRR